MTDNLGSLRQFLKAVVRPAIYGRRAPLEVAAHHLHGEPVPAIEAVGRPFTPFEVGSPWGGMWDTTWFRFRGSIPDSWAGAEVVALIHLGGDQMVGFTAEGQIWDTGLRPVQGLHHRHREFVLTREALGVEPVEFFVEAAANPIPPWLLADWPLLLPDYQGAPLYILETAELAIADRSVEGLFLDMRVLIEMAALDPDRSEEIIPVLDKARSIIDPENVSDSGVPARDVLAPLLDRPTSSANAVVAVGHAHIDCAWLWPLRETRRKCARTFSNQLRVLERYPEHHFVCSQAVQYQWMKDGYPQLYEQIGEQVRSGRWEPVGGMWVEPDTNVPSGESLVRQLVYGKRFFAEEFGVETHELWIPDVFGYSAALPQIAREAGVTSFITQKMSWNDTNAFPHTSFWWEGHDGSRLLAHFPPANTYNGDFSIGEVAAGQDRGLGPNGTALNLYPFGYGDGGGGPNHIMVERFHRMTDVDGLPRVEIGTVAGFLDRLRQEADDFPVWVGELYLETHRATLTTHADVKLANRRAEEALRAAELWSVAASLDRRPDLDRAWKLLLLHQFHDILPGSSIHWVYEDTARELAEVLAIAGSVSTEAQTVVAGGDEALGVVAFNASSTDRTEVAALPDGSLALVSAPACGWSTVLPDRSLGGRDQVTIGEDWLDNGLLRVEWDGDGLLTSVRDLVAGRQVLAHDERGNLFQLHDDHPRAFDAWDVDRSYLDQVTDLLTVDSIEVLERHPLRGAVRFIRSFGASTITQTMRLAAGSRRLEFHTDVEWHERHRFLKVAFPVSIRSTRATYEIQHGHLERPTVVNTSWDEARFEVCGHRWADLSEPGYGVALLNESKYGYDIVGHTMRLSLLRAPGFPDPEADQGFHHFAYALVPHHGDLRESGVIAEAEHFNLPLSLIAGQGEGSVVSVDRPGVSVEAVKWADRSDAVVVRLCEVWGSRGPVRVRLHRPFVSVTRTDLLERAVSSLANHDGTVELELRPFELVTLAFDLD
ncbi:MAG TPA: glycoside hydrolase family 38 C-terminal domain-containing protein [Acidimicrobiales bacterium]|jgi:alpha-mannosidase|nr:glycoside hydrolase family 38 C-terminal domain-containing protein [Acidimicrobiales bacterium]